MIAALKILTIVVPLIPFVTIFPRFVAALRTGSYDQGRLHLDRHSDSKRFARYMAMLGVAYAVLAVMLVRSTAEAVFYFSH